MLSDVFFFGFFVAAGGADEVFFQLAEGLEGGFGGIVFLQEAPVLLSNKCVLYQIFRQKSR